jgi:tight adherence protein B
VSPALLTLLTFGAAASAVAGAYSIASDLYLRDRSRVSQRIDDEFRRRQRARAERSLLFKDLGKMALETGAYEGQPGPRQWFEALVEQSGLDLTSRRLATAAAGSALTLGWLGLLIRGSAAVAAVAAVLGGAVPILYVHLKRKARLEKLLGQLPDAFDLMGRVVRAGQTMSQSLQAVVDEFPQPIAGEFNYCYEQQNLGLSTEAAMRDLARRTGLLEVKIFVLALLVQQQAGGNLAELLDKLSGVIRERQKVRGQIRALTAEGRLQAIILLGLAPAVFVMMMMMNRDYASELLLHPSLIGGTLACEAFGALWIRKIVNFDF